MPHAFWDANTAVNAAKRRGKEIGRCDRRSPQMLQDLAGTRSGRECGHRHCLPGQVRRAGTGPVYLAEDALQVVRERVEGIARHRGLDLNALEIYVITAPTLRLDREPHRMRLFDTAKRLWPRLVVLDPLVRLHRIDENHATEVAGLLAYFRSLQRRLDVSVVLVHHTRKNAPGGVAAAQGLRGSSNLHAFGDSNLYLRRARDRLVVSSEHRAAPASPPVYLELVSTNAETTHLKVIAELADDRQHSLQEQVLTFVAQGVVLTRAKLRDALAVKNERLGEALESLERAGRIHRPRHFSVNVATRRYYCHRCHSKGNQLELWAAVTKLPFRRSAVHLCHMLGREVPWIQRW